MQELVKWDCYSVIVWILERFLPDNNFNFIRNSEFVFQFRLLLVLCALVEAKPFISIINIIKNILKHADRISSSEALHCMG